MDSRPLTGKVAFVTGAGSPIGFGRAMTFALVRAGARVAAFDVNREWLDGTVRAVRDECGEDSVFPLLGSVANPADVEESVGATVSRFGSLDVLVNNAGTNPINMGLASRFRLKAWEVSPEAWDKVFGVNCSGPFFTIRAVVEQMIERGWGRIIGVTTSLNTMYKAHGSPYGPSKAAHEALMATVAQELEGTGVTANILVPGGPANTHLIPQDAEYDRAELIQADIMQKPVVWLASDASNGVSGQRFIAYHWDDSLPLEQRLARASAPAAWPQAGQASIQPRT